jgi:hypothetical protein
MNEDEELANTIARARNLQADAIDDEIQEIANEVRTGKTDPNAGRTAIWAMQWRASKLRPKKYGDKLTHEGNEESPISHDIVVKFVD